MEKLKTEKLFILLKYLELGGEVIFPSNIILPKNGVGMICLRLEEGLSFMHNLIFCKEEGYIYANPATYTIDRLCLIAEWLEGQPANNSNLYENRLCEMKMTTPCRHEKEKNV